MSLDWHRLRAVVLESDDWGLCAWSPDDQAHRVLAGTPAFRDETGRVYGRSTLESADDVRQLALLLQGMRGADALPPVLQANTIVGAPDFDRLQAPLFEVGDFPVRLHPDAPSRWKRPGLWEAVRAAESAGVWWAELHGLHHLPVEAWLHALRRGQDDARRSHEQQVFVCQAVEASGEYDPGEPLARREANLQQAIAGFARLFGRVPTSFCPPDYRADDWLERQAELLGVKTIQGRAERPAGGWTRIERGLRAWTFPHRDGERFYMPPRIGFEPRGHADAGGPQGSPAAVEAARGAWQRGQPAVISTHRLNYAHLDPDWSLAGRSALGALLAELTAQGAVYLVDLEVRQLVERGWSLRPIGSRGALLRHHGEARDELVFPLPEGVQGARLEDIRGAGATALEVRDGQVALRVAPGDHVVEWVNA